MTIQRGDLITVALRGDAGKPRPALVIQADHFVDLSTVVVLPLTSTLLDLPLVRVTIEPLPATGLQQRSQVMISRPQFAPRARLGPVIGSIDTGTLLEVTAVSQCCSGSDDWRDPHSHPHLRDDRNRAGQSSDGRGPAGRQHTHLERYQL